MQEVVTLLPGAVIGGHYLVVDLVGKGGFSAVYLVQDQQREENFFALKEAIITHKEVRERFTFEYSVLEHLVHPALPRVYSVFDNEEHNRLYMLMDYVEGPNLEMLRRIQPDKRFPFPIIIALLAPVMDALACLHQQNPPIIHRDIKPANIIVPIAEGKTILVDFGISKQYDMNRTTSAVRYGSPGYGAPEHYTKGTNIRTDIYGLGATLYTLLTGVIPPDAIERMTQLSNENTDPLKPVDELVSTIPLHVSRAIQRAMSIRMGLRFATVKEFWQALQGETRQPPISEAINSIVALPAVSDVSKKTEKTLSISPKEKQMTNRRLRKRFLLPIFLVLLAIVGIAASYWGFPIFNNHRLATKAGSNSTSRYATLTPTSHASVINQPTYTQNSYPRLSPSYYGTLEDLQANVASQMALTQMLQIGGHISGSFSAMHISAQYIGSIDASRNISFTIVSGPDHVSLNFTGIVQASGSLKGTFCEIDQNGQCISDGVFGLWSIAPGTSGK